MEEKKNLPVDELRNLIEGLLFVFSDGINVQDIRKGLDNDPAQIKMVLDTLVDDYLERDGGIILQESAGIYKFVTHPKIFESMNSFLVFKKKETLSRAMLETLAIITYKQPITLFEVEEIRGVNCRSIVTSLQSKNLIKAMGQKEAPGRPTLFGTTKEFLKYFGINSLEDLPSPREIKELNTEEL